MTRVVAVVDESIEASPEAVELTEQDLELLGPEPTLVPRGERVQEVPTSQGEVPPAVYLSTARSGRRAGVAPGRALAVFLGSMGLTTTAILGSYALVLVAGGPRVGSEPILVQTPVLFPVVQPVDAPVRMEGEIEAGLDKVQDPSVEVLAEPVGGPDDAALGVGRGESVAQGGRPGGSGEAIAQAVDASSPPAPVQVVRVRSSAPVPAPTAAPPAPPAPPPAPVVQTVQHPLSGSYGGRGQGEPVQVDLDFRSDGTVRAVLIREGGERATARGTFQSRRTGGLAFIVVEGSGPDRITWSGNAVEGRASGRVIQAGRTVGRFAISQ